MALEERIVKKHLYEWLLDHNAIVIPQLGRFEAMPTSATIQPGVYKFLPPNKKVTFHAEHDATDVQLRDLLMEREQLTGEQANYTINVFVQKVKEALSTKQRYELEGFGLLSQLNEHTIIFRIDEEANVEGDSFGLPGLYPKPLVHAPEPVGGGNDLSKTNPDLPPYEGEQEEYKPVTDPKAAKETTESTEPPQDDVTVEERRVNQSSNTIVVTLLTITFAVAVVFVFLLITDSNPFYSSADADAKKKEKVEGKKTDNGEAKDEKKDETKDTAKDEKNAEPKDEKPAKEDIDKKSPPKSIPPAINYPTNNNFTAKFAWLPQQPANVGQVLLKNREHKSFVVLGSFDKAENAYSYYNNLAKQGVSTACIIAPTEGNSRYRVCLGKYGSVEDATKEGMTFGKAHAIGFFVFVF